ncbi:MAG: hypothetical protein JO249_22885 [Acidobacteria bacterium]|nr:hypothetical protein [Acidobacteriota bacterium]
MNLRWGLITASLSAALILGGSALAQTAQQPDKSPSAVQPSPTAPDSSKPMSEEPSMTSSQAGQEQQPTPQVNDQTRDRDQSRDRDSMGQNSSKMDRDSAGNENKTMNRDVKEFDHFLDKHPEVAQELQNDPSKINDGSFVSNHKELQRWLEKHPQVRDEIKENPSAFMHRENRYEKNENKPQ